MMKKLYFILICALPLIGYSQNDTVYYFGVNGKIDSQVKKDIKKEVDFKGKNKKIVKTYKAVQDDWQLIYTEKIKTVNDSVFDIRMKSDKFSGRITRIFKPLDNGHYLFTDSIKNGIKRYGSTTQKVPLLFDGTVTENYVSGKVKSISEYKNNELISNQNWLADGTPLVDDIFYSVDTEPRFEPGMGFIHQQVSLAIEKSKFDLSTVEGRMVVGLVITKEGEIGGVQIVKGITQDLNGILADAFMNIKGAWVPAKLDGKEVNYFQLLPINFIYSRYNFDSLEFTGGMLFWVIN
jgi:hypothetical protein